MTAIPMYRPSPASSALWKTAQAVGSLPLWNIDTARYRLYRLYRPLQTA